MSLQITAADKI